MNKTKRYFAFNSYLREIFGSRVQKIGLDAGLGCPNRDIARGSGGCIFCSNESFSYHSRDNQPDPLDYQIERAIEYMRVRFDAEKFIAYFQAYSSTFAPLEILREKYSIIEKYPEICGLFIATRPDCIPDEVLRLVGSYRERYLTWLELGLQSSCDETLKLIRRGHSAEDFVRAVTSAHNNGLKVCAHVILGLPGESRETMLETARFLARLRVDGVKLHPLHIVRGTTLERMHKEKPVKLLGLDEYGELVCDFLEMVPGDMVVHRFSADVRKADLIAPEWCSDKHGSLAAVTETMEKRDFRQGRLF